MYALPLGHVLRGFCCDPSGFDKDRFAVYKFCLPLYVPTTHVYFTFGDRLRDDGGCDILCSMKDDSLVASLTAHMQCDGIPFLSSVTGPREMINAAARLLKPWKSTSGKRSPIQPSWLATMDKRHWHSTASRARSRRTSPGKRMFWTALRQLESALERDVAAAMQLLKDWELFSVNNLSLAAPSVPATCRVPSRKPHRTAGQASSGTLRGRATRKPGVPCRLIFLRPARSRAARLRACRGWAESRRRRCRRKSGSRRRSASSCQRSDQTPARAPNAHRRQSRSRACRSSAPMEYVART